MVGNITCDFCSLSESAHGLKRLVTPLNNRRYINYFIYLSMALWF